MKKERPIYVVAKSDAVEVKELVEASERLQVPLRVVRFENLEEMEDVAENASVVYWRSGKLVNRFPTHVIRPTVFSRLVRDVPVINYGTAATSGQVYKSVQQEVFKRHERAAKDILPVPTFLAPDKEAIMALLADGSLSYPFIAKPNAGSRGEGVELIKEEKDLDELVSLETHVFQPFIRNTGDYRIFVTGGVAHMVFKRVATDDSTYGHLNNLSQGGARLPVNDVALYQKLAKAGSVIAAMFGYTVCGVDILEAEDGTLYFLEVNSAPQWFGWQDTTDRSVAEHVIKTLAAVASPKNEDTIFREVEKYYLDNLDYLPPGTRFHFLSRLHLWSGKKKYIDEIRKAREPWWTSMPSVVQELSSSQIDQESGNGSKAYRKEARSAHPLVVPYNNFFFKCVFDRTIFGGNAFEEFKDRIDLERLREARARLFADPRSLFVLSTVAVNFLYHYDHFLGNDDGLFDPTKLLEIPEKHGVDNKADDLDARIYYYTHMIIGASRFYSAKIPETELPVYLEALKRVESLILANYAECTIDHKAEFVVCARLCGYSSPIEPAIRSELVASCSPHGAFLINTHNTHKDGVFKQTLETAEHSNVLALMAFGG